MPVTWAVKADTAFSTTPNPRAITQPRSLRRRATDRKHCVKLALVSGPGVSLHTVFFVDPGINQRECNRQHNGTDKNANQPE